MYMCVCMYVYIYIYIYTHTHTHTHTHTYIYIYIYTHTHTHSLASLLPLDGPNSWCCTGGITAVYYKTQTKRKNTLYEQGTVFNVKPCPTSILPTRL